ncbi:MAG: SDR family oxidoreductase, partial [Kiritimatiellia bacterium]
AIEGLSAALAQELPRGMCCVALNPGIIDTDMLRESWAEDTSQFPSPEQWARQAVPFLLSLDARHNGRPLTVPGVPD